MRNKIFGAICAVIFYVVGGTVAYACVENVSSKVGTAIRNGCPYTVNVTWCFGRGCTPPTGGTRVGVGKFLQLSGNPQPFQVSYCKYPQKVAQSSSGKRGCR